MTSTTDEFSSGNESHELSAKQVRELRRLCRKTANRAEFDDRSVQVRQIASILAMGTPSLQQFAPGYWKSGSGLQAWVDRVRRDGADWRDERILLPEAVDELRDWDRLLKIWARRRFVNGDGADEDIITASHSNDANINDSRDLRTELSSSSKTPLQKRNSMSWMNSSPVSNASPLAANEEIIDSTPAPIRRTKSVLRPREKCPLGSPTTPNFDKENISSRPRLVPASFALASSPVAVDDDADEKSQLHRQVIHEQGKLGTSRKPLSNITISRQGNTISVDFRSRHSSMQKLGKSSKRDQCQYQSKREQHEPSIVHVPEFSASSNGDDKENWETRRDWTSLRKPGQGKSSAPTFR